MRRLLNKLLSYFPTRLPVGRAEFDIWADSIIELSGAFADKTSMLFAISSILIHADAKHGSLPKNYFVRRLIKSAANQVASQVFQDVKVKQAEEQAKLQAEATASKESSVANESKKD